MAGRHVEDLQVGSADPARLDLDDDLIGPLDGRLRVRFHAHVARSVEDGRFHRATAASRARTVARGLSASTNSPPRRAGTPTAAATVVAPPLPRRLVPVPP